MSLLIVVLAAAAILAAAYFLYGGLLARLFRLDPAAKTPAVELRDDHDYVPIEPKFLITQHFSAIAAAGPIVGPILATLWFGWAPALAWILLGSIFVGGVHDMGSLLASVRHKARSIAEVLREYMTQRSYVLFLLFIWLTLVYIIVAFTDLVACSFVGTQDLTQDAAVGAAASVAVNAITVRGAAIASSSLLYLTLAIVMGVLLRYARLPLNWATAIFLPLVGLAIWAGQFIPLDLAGLLGITDAQAIKVWDVLLLGYCLVAGALPMWLLLQPRGHLGGYFLFVAILGAMIGLLTMGLATLLGTGPALPPIQFPAFRSWDSTLGPMVPILMITVACGACSGFHCLVASGTTSKQLQRETHAKVVGYGAMLAEGLVAVLSLACVMMLTSQQAAELNSPNYIYAKGLARCLNAFGIPVAFALSFGLLTFTTFVYDTLDVCTRLGRYIVQELMGWRGAAGRWIGTGITALVPLFFVTRHMVDPVSGQEQPAWKLFWWLFGASNQLLAALALLCILTWLWQTRRAMWVWPVVGLPMAWMYVMSVWSLGLFIRRGFFTPEWQLQYTANPVPWAALVLTALAVLVLIEAFRVFLGRPVRPGAEPLDAAASRAA